MHSDRSSTGRPLFAGARLALLMVCCAVATPLALTRTAHAESGCPPIGGTSGYRPLQQPSDVACAVTLAKPIPVAILCQLSVNGHYTSDYALPGMQVAALAPSPIGVRVRLPSGAEGDIRSICLSWSETGVSLVPNRNAKNDVSTVKALLSALYKVRKALDRDIHVFMKSRDFVRPPPHDPEIAYPYDPAWAYLSTRFWASTEYGQLMHNLIYGVNSPGLTRPALLALDGTAWLADWPQIVLESYLHGLDPKDRESGAAAEDELTLRAQALTVAMDRADLKRQEHIVDIIVDRLPEPERSREKKRRLDVIAAQRQELSTKLQSLERKAQQTAAKVRL